MSAGNRKVIRVGPKGRNEHFQNLNCQYTGCAYIVEEHQRWGKPEAAEVPEFTIEVAYKTTMRDGSKAIPGWRYALKWRENGEQKSDRSYGYEDKESALRSAKRRAKEIALAFAPVHVETFTPDI